MTSLPVDISPYRQCLWATIATWGYSGSLECLPMLASQISIRSNEQSFRKQICELIPESSELVEQRLLKLAMLNRAHAVTENVRLEGRPLTEIVRIWDAWIDLVNFRTDIYYEDADLYAYSELRKSALRKAFSNAGRFIRTLFLGGSYTSRNSRSISKF
ncbi:MAG: hypothetical protein LUC43_06705 [Burkholderiales bacterium]|nr:hypothetical protein [Burkholderiales bacterium]